MTLRMSWKPTRCLKIVDEFAEEADEWEIAFCDALKAALAPADDPVDDPADDPVDEPATNETVTEEDVEEAADEVPGFGLISAVAAIGAVLLLRRRL